MKLCQFYLTDAARSADLQRRWPREARLGVLDGDTIVDLTDGFGAPDLDGPTPNAAVALLLSGRAPEACASADAPRYDPEQIFLGPPVLRPSNFRRRA